MRDLSVSLPSWAYREGYRLEGGMGTYNDLYLLKDGGVVKGWACLERQPNIFELEEFIIDVESQITGGY